MKKAGKAKHAVPRRGYSVREVAEMYNVSPSTIRKRIRDGTINIVTCIGPWRIPESALERLGMQKLRKDEE